jgi:ribosomal protein L18E
MSLLGFAFRSPEVIKFLIPAAQYHVLVVPDKPSEFAATVPTFMKQANGGRKRVYLHKSLIAMVTLFREKKLNPDTDYHIVFDAYSVLIRYPCIKILDVESRDAETWQLRNTIPSLVDKILGSAKPGISVPDQNCILERLIQPEDLITTDKRVDEAERLEKVRSFLHVIQDIQAKNAEKRNVISFWITAFYAGVLVDSKHVLKQKTVPVNRYTPTPIKATVYVEKSDKLARDRMLSSLTEHLRRDGFELRKHSLAKLGGLIGNPEHVTTLRALLLMQELNWTPERAAHQTGANISALALIQRSLNDRTYPHSLAVVNQNHLYQNGIVVVPGKLFKTVADQKKKVVAEKVTKSKAKKMQKSKTVSFTVVSEAVDEKKSTAVKVVDRSFYSLLQLCQALELVPRTATLAVALQLSRTPITTSATKYKRGAEGVVYRIQAGSRYWVRFGSKKHRFLGV